MGSVKIEAKQEPVRRNRTNSNHSPSIYSRDVPTSINIPPRHSQEGHTGSRNRITSAPPPGKRVTLKHEAIFDNLLESQKYDVYTSDGAASIEGDYDIAPKALGERKMANTAKSKKVSVGNVSKNIE